MLFSKRHSLLEQDTCLRVKVISPSHLQNIFCDSLYVYMVDILHLMSILLFSYIKVNRGKGLKFIYGVSMANLIVLLFLVFAKAEVIVSNM